MPRVQDILLLVGVQLETIELQPIVIHAVVMAIFASLIAPFGGFFASGLKRAFKIKVALPTPVVFPAAGVFSHYGCLFRTLMT